MDQRNSFAVKEFSLLVVDDEPAVAEFIQEVACDAGFRARAVCDSPDFSVAEMEMPDMLVLDLQMPGRDGVETIRALAQGHRGTAVLFASGLGARMLATATELATAQGLRVMGAMTKPFSYSELLQALRQAREALQDTAPAAASATVTAGSLNPTELRAAIGNGDIRVHYQPIIAVNQGTVVSLEALARWDHPHYGAVPPSTFVPAAEKHHLGWQLNWSVAMTVLQEMREHFAAPPAVSVNFSASDLANLAVPDLIDTAIREKGLEPGALNIELTESALIHDLPRVLDTMMRLRMKGMGLWLDDFGTGYSSMEQLRRLPLTGVKIDRSFVPRGADDTSKAALLQSLLDISRKLGLPAVVEGVETEEQLELMARLGCERVQGYLIARPMPIESLAQWLRGREAAVSAAR